MFVLVLCVQLTSHMCVEQEFRELWALPLRAPGTIIVGPPHWSVRGSRIGEPRDLWGFRRYLLSHLGSVCLEFLLPLGSASLVQGQEHSLAARFVLQA